MQITGLPLHRLHQKRLGGEITTLQIVQAYLERIKAVDKELGAFLYVNGESSLVQAEAVDKKLARGGKIGTLEGMPIAVKDNFNTRGIPTTCASKILKDYVAPYESTVTRKLIENGYILIGKTNMDEFAMGSSNENSAFWPAKNPWDLERVPGGSSGGSAVAVAANLAAGAIGSDTGGSIRQPASFTNIVGFKPTYGRVSRWGMVAFASSLDQAGPMTQDVEDAALILKAISGHDELDATSLKVEVPDYLRSLNQPVKSMKLGIIKNLDLESCDSQVVDIYKESINFYQKQGVELVEIEIPNLEHVVATYYIIGPCEASSNLGRYDGIRYGLRSDAKALKDLYEESRDLGFGNEVKIRILLGTFALSAGYYDAYYLKAQKIQNIIRHQFKEAFRQVDAIACPVTTTPAFKLGERINDPLKMYLSDIFSIPPNLAGLPALSIPAGITKNNLPVGLQLIGDHLQEGKLFQLAHFFEQNHPIEKPKLMI
ncbi:MAG: Asp-tRNA(Asn)/Glu-tRNA(Gln) amidotransferase subunit GatA [Deltaproteobacteria bacterium]|nr:Asp-tRNA(Asn)/Glu-tRNA(Gln) amidotransferase subunit GatA [Deltaproteobacteria bacterium]